MTDAAQNLDAFSLDECLAVMYLNSDVPGDYVEGYRSGYLGEPYEFGRGSVYARGRAAGMDALDRGAHGASEAVVIGIIEEGA